VNEYSLPEEIRKRRWLNVYSKYSISQEKDMS